MLCLHLGVVQAAHLFGLPRLLELAEWRARSELCLQSSVRLANLAYRRNAAQLLRACVHFLTVNDGIQPQDALGTLCPEVADMVGAGSGAACGPCHPTPLGAARDPQLGPCTCAHSHTYAPSVNDCVRAFAVASPRAAKDVLQVVPGAAVPRGAP